MEFHMLLEFNWAIHIWSIPLAILTGFMLGWIARGVIDANRRS